jgi:LmbE family N-acetylglucosaminyl deacetylase
LPELPENWERALCVAAHPDDLEYGAAAAVARWTAQGKQVGYLLVTRGEAGIDGLDPAEAGVLREREERAGAAEVGVTDLEFLDHADGVVEYGLPLRRDITRAIRRFRPEIVVTGAYGERMAGGVPNQADHRAVGLAALDAARDAGNRWIFPDLGPEPWPGVRAVCFAGAPEATHGVDVSDHLVRGIASLSAHEAYLKGLGPAAPDPAAFLSWIAAAAGARLDVDAAVLLDVYELISDGPAPWA